MDPIRRTCTYISFILLLITGSIANASEPDSAKTSGQILRPLLSAYTFEAGSAGVTDTYLSSLRHSGIHLGLGYERMQAMKFDPQKWIMRLHGNLSVENTKNNPSRNATVWDIDFDIGWDMMFRFRTRTPVWSFTAGGTTDLSLGALYSTRNGNNPVSAKASWTIGATGAVILNTRIGRLPVCARYQLSMPLTGVFFSPDYGELYYEIYLGNHSGLAHAAWPGNFFRLDNRLSVDLRFGATIVRVGYSGRIFSSKASGLITRTSSHCLSLGFACEWLSLGTSRNRRLNDAQIISALY